MAGPRIFFRARASRLYAAATVARFALGLGDHYWALPPGVHRIGRDPACEIVLSHDSVSRRHATLRAEDERVTVEDAGSRNGVKVNGEKLRARKELVSGDTLNVGTFELVLVDREQTPAPAAATRPLPKLRVEEEDALAALSPRERDVLVRLARGETQRAIAEALGLSVKTVETYRARIGEKLGLETRADLVRFALEAGLLRS